MAWHDGPYGLEAFDLAPTQFLLAAFTLGKSNFHSLMDFTLGFYKNF
jgi:hypothetical protein